MSAWKRLITAVLLTSVSGADAFADTSHDRRHAIRIEQLEARVEWLLKRLQKMENPPGARMTDGTFAGFRVDRHGILRDRNGDVGGFWGIDNVQVPTAR